MLCFRRHKILGTVTDDFYAVLYYVLIVPFLFAFFWGLMFSDSHLFFTRLSASFVHLLCNTQKPLCTLKIKAS